MHLLVDFFLILAYSNYVLLMPLQDSVDGEADAIDGRGKRQILPTWLPFPTFRRTTKPHIPKTEIVTKKTVEVVKITIVVVPVTTPDVTKENLPPTPDPLPPGSADTSFPLKIDTTIPNTQVSTFAPEPNTSSRPPRPSPEDATRPPLPPPTHDSNRQAAHVDDNKNKRRAWYIFLAISLLTLIAITAFITLCVLISPTATSRGGHSRSHTRSPKRKKVKKAKK